jgi:hypothetical protein
MQAQTQEEMMDDNGYMLCGKVGTPDYIVLDGSSIVDCCKCEAKLWVTPASRDMISEKKLLTICFPCFLKEKGVAGVFQAIAAGLTEEQAKEVEAYNARKN